MPLSTAYAISEAVGVERSVSRRFAEAPLFLGLFTGQIVIGAAVALAPGNLIELLINTQVLNGLITPIILVFILILANRRSVLGDAVNGPLFRVVATICVVGVSRHGGRRRGADRAAAGSGSAMSAPDRIRGGPSGLPLRDERVRALPRSYRLRCRRRPGGSEMGIGTGIFLLAVGAILRFAVTTTAKGVNIQTVGDILMIVGAPRNPAVSVLLEFLGGFGEAAAPRPSSGIARATDGPRVPPGDGGTGVVGGPASEWGAQAASTAGVAP